MTSCWSSCVGFEAEGRLDSSSTQRCKERLSAAPCPLLSAAPLICLAHASRNAWPDKIGANPATSPSSLACTELAPCSYSGQHRGALTT